MIQEAGTKNRPALRRANRIEILFGFPRRQP
jgi:hypothetical protein